MRWVNHYTHPGDTRYHVFVFREAHYASRFEERCREEKLPYERHEEEGEVMFGIAKTHFQAALRANHLVHAEFRSHFIPNKGWRWGLLAFTGVVLALALWGWLTATSAHGQVEAGLPWELDVVGRCTCRRMHLGWNRPTCWGKESTPRGRPAWARRWDFASTED